jgi:hypothetical protein
VIFRRLGCLPPSENGNEVRAWLHDCVQESEQWRASPPTDGEGERLMKRVLALHVAVTKMERDALLEKDGVAPGAAL